MTLAQQMQAEIDAAKEIQAAAKKAGRDITADEKSTIDSHLDQAEALKAQAAEEEQAQKDRAATLSRLEAADAELRSRGPRAGRGATAPVAGAGAAPAVAREAFLDDPKRGFASTRDFFLAVQRVGQGGAMAPNLKSVLAPRTGMQATAGSDEQSGFSDSYGGFLVPKGLVPGVLTVGFDGDPMAGRTRMIPMSSPKVLLNARVDKTHTTSVSGGLRVYRRAEASSVSSSRMQFEQVELDAAGLMGVAFATEEILRDSPESFAAILEQGFRDEFASKLIRERLSGTGTGEYLGIANAGCLIDVAKEVGQAAATINYTNLVKMRARCWGYGNAVWYANHDTIPQLFAVTAPGSTVPLFTQDSQGIASIFGRPVIFGEFAETLGTVGDLVLGNWGEYLEGVYEPIQGASSIHVRFVEHESAFKFWMRCAGAPWWRTVLTPAKGATLAPFVRLATRA